MAVEVWTAELRMAWWTLWCLRCRRLYCEHGSFRFAKLFSRSEHSFVGGKHVHLLYPHKPMATRTLSHHEGHHFWLLSTTHASHLTQKCDNAHCSPDTVPPCRNAHLLQGIYMKSDRSWHVALRPCSCICANPDRSLMWLDISWISYALRCNCTVAAPLLIRIGMQSVFYSFFLGGPPEAQCDRTGSVNKTYSVHPVVSPLK